MIYPIPPSPLNLALVVIVGWLLLGMGVLGLLHTRHPEVLQRSGQLLIEPETGSDQER